MNILAPFTVDNTALVSSTLSEDDYSAWLVGTTYDVDDYVIVAGTDHSVYQSVQGSNTGNDPSTDDGTWWTRIGATNLWKALDLDTNDIRLSDRTTGTSPFSFTLTFADYVQGVALFNIDGANEAEVTVTADAVEVYNETVSLIDDTMIIDSYAYCFEPITSVTELVLDDLPAYLNAEVKIELTDGAGGTIGVGQIVAGAVHPIGETLLGAQIGIRDYSSVERDAFGYAQITKRAYTQTVSYPVAIPAQQSRRIQRILGDLISTPVVMYAGEDTDQFGTTVFGIFTRFTAPITARSTTKMSLDAEGFAA